MTTAHDAYVNALLADAAYVDGLDGLSKEDLIQRLSGRMTDTQATYIGARFSVLVQVSDPTSSFEATVWKEETTGNVYVSIRGTQGFRDVLEDADLATSGLAHAQLVAMVNWWLRATSIGMAPQIAVDEGIPDEGSAGVPGNFVAANPVQGTGELADISTIKSVNGHSLGGYLATAFSRIFGAFHQP